LAGRLGQLKGSIGCLLVFTVWENVLMTFGAGDFELVGLLTTFSVQVGVFAL